MNNIIDFNKYSDHINNLIESVNQDKPKQLKRISLQFNQLIYLYNKSSNFLNNEIIDNLRLSLLNKINQTFYQQLINYNKSIESDIIEIIRTYEILNSLDNAQLTFKQFTNQLLDSIEKNDLFDNIINLIRRRISPLTNLFEKCHNSTKIRESLKQTQLSTSNPSDELINGYDFYDNALYSQIELVILNKLGLDLFAVGKPNEFQQNYKNFLSFLQSIESLSPSIESVIRLRDYANKGLLQRFQLNSYFQLRFKEVVGVVEGAFHSPLIYCQPSDDYIIKQSERLDWALNRCWNDQVVIVEIIGKFWKLNLQLLSRYKVWLDDKMDQYLIQKSTDGNDEDLFEFLVNSRVDIDRICDSTTNLWNNTIKQKIQMIVGDDIETIESSLTDSIDLIKVDFGQSCLNLLTSILISSSSKHLSGIKGVYRLSSPRKQHDKPSEFIDLMMNDINDFNKLDKLTKYHNEINQKVFHELIERYINQINEIKSQESNFMKYKRGLGSTKDSNQINKQIELDIDYLKSILHQFNIPVDKLEELR